MSRAYEDRGHTARRGLSLFKNIGFISHGASPERRLMTSMLMQALHDLEHRSPRVREDAFSWIIASDEASDWPFTFEACCNELSICVSKARAQARLLMQHH
jgi:hypothetical protein